jgi:hypothetical protein
MCDLGQRNIDIRLSAKASFFNFVKARASRLNFASLSQTPESVAFGINVTLSTGGTINLLSIAF